MIFDLISISSRYIDRELFVTPRQVNEIFKMEEADKIILKDSSDFRVYEPRLDSQDQEHHFFIIQ